MSSCKDLLSYPVIWHTLWVLIQVLVKYWVFSSTYRQNPTGLEGSHLSAVQVEALASDLQFQDLYLIVPFLFNWGIPDVSFIQTGFNPTQDLGRKTVTNVRGKNYVATSASTEKHLLGVKPIHNSTCTLFWCSTANNDASKFPIYWRFWEAIGHVPQYFALVWQRCSTGIPGIQIHLHDAESSLKQMQ